MIDVYAAANPVASLACVFYNTWYSLWYLSSIIGVLGLVFGSPFSIRFVWKDNRRWQFLVGTIIGMVVIIVQYQYFSLSVLDRDYWGALLAVLLSVLPGFVIGTILVAAFRYARKGTIVGLGLHLLLVIFYFAGRSQNWWVDDFMQRGMFVPLAVTACVWSIGVFALTDIVAHRIKKAR